MAVATSGGSAHFPTVQEKIGKANSREEGWDWKGKSNKPIEKRTEDTNTNKHRKSHYCFITGMELVKLNREDREFPNGPHTASY